MELSQVINERRSVREYRSDPVPDAVLEQVLEAARMAPSWANSQVTRFFAVKDPAVKQLIQEAVSKWNPALDALGQAPIILVAAGIRGKSGFYKGAPSNSNGDYAMFDVALAVENAILKARELGLGTVLVGIFNVGKIKAALKLPAEMDPFILTPIGYPVSTDQFVPTRKEISELLYWDRYEEKK